MEVPPVTKNAPDLYLASTSPRRKELLQQIGVRFEVLRVSVEEKHRANEAPAAYVQRLARDKALAGLQCSSGTPVLGADTIGVLDNQVLEKPADEADAVQMLLAMSGRWHTVISGVAIATEQNCVSCICETTVHFAQLDEALIRRYWLTGEPRDKSGAYGIQGKGAVFVEGIEGSYSNVVGLPLTETAQLLDQFGIAIWR